MKLLNLEKLVDAHNGKFICQKIHDESKTKTVTFKHVYDHPIDESTLEDLKNQFGSIGKLVDFYETFGSLEMYVDSVSGDSALYIGNPSQWEELEGYFAPWIEDLDDEEMDYLPDWIDNRLTIGEIPSSGNYILMPISGEKAGFVFEFEHDGFEFIELAENIEAFIVSMLNLTTNSLTNMASHMRFVEGDPHSQWWIKECHDSNGKVVSTEK